MLAGTSCTIYKINHRQLATKSDRDPLRIDQRADEPETTVSCRDAPAVLVQFDQITAPIYTFEVRVLAQ